MQLNDKRVIVTGGAGFLGSCVVQRLQKLGVAALAIPRTAACDLADAAAVARLYREFRPDVVFHLAARVGGIGANLQNPGAYFYDNMIMGMNVLEQARHSQIEKVVLVGTICSYPKFAPVPFREVDLWNGYPEETNAPYGIAKKALMVMADAYRRQYDLNAICLLPVNLYGPEDNFDLQMSHVIPAMIRKFHEANMQGSDCVSLWGDGTPTREFLFVDDCAEALILAAERYESSEPVNVGAGFEISIRELAALVARLMSFQGAIRWDASRPNGQPRRKLDTTLASERFGFRAKTSLEEGLTRTIEWYRAQA